MIRRIIKSGVEAREELAKGAKFLAEAVGGTFGPFGYNWFLDKQNKVTNDGVTVAREIQLSNEVQNRGAAAVREASIKTVDAVGEGTSGAAMLTWAIYDAISKYLPKLGVKGKKTAAELRVQLDRELKEVLESLTKMATPIETEEQLINSGRVSTESDELGALIGSAQWKLGKEGYLLAEETAERESSVEFVKGIRIDNGFGTSQIVNNQEKQILEVEDTRVVLTSYSIKTIPDWQKILKIYEKVVQAGGQRLVVIARAWTDETINFALQNIAKGASIYPLNAPYVDMQERFKDLAAVTGATFYDSEAYSLEDMRIEDVGHAQKVTARRFDAVITGKNDEETRTRVVQRISEITAKHAGSQSEFEKKQLLERAAQLNCGFGIVKIGSASDMERHRLFDKAEDAVNAVRAAFQEGTVPGGGLAFKQISDSLPDTYILKRPLLVLYEQIMSTAPDGFVIEDWVRDPLKVLKVALENACTSAMTFASAGGVVTQAFPKEVNELLKLSTASPEVDD